MITVNSILRNFSLIRCVELIVASIVIVSIVGCAPKRYEDVSDEEQYRFLLGRQIITRTDMLLTGVTFDPNYKQIVDYIFLMPYPGITGPQVVFRKKLPCCEKFEICGVLKSKKSIPTRLVYALKGYDSDIECGRGVVLKVFENIDDGNLGLDEHLFYVVER